MSDTTKSLVWVDNIRVLATCSVILLHVSAQVVESYPAIPLATWWVANLYDSAVRAGVPLFIMLTGALLLPQQQVLSVFLRKRVTRILWPFLFWSAIYIAYEYTLRLQSGNALAPLGLLRWVYGNLQHGAAFHLWYVYTILALYALVPILRPWVQTAPASEIQYFLGIWGVTLWSSYYVIGRWGIDIDLHNFSGYLGYLILGYYLTFRQPRSQRAHWAAIGAIGLGFCLTAAGTYYLSLKSHHDVETAYGNLTPNVALMAAGIYYLLQHAAWPAPRGIWRFICDNSYTIYLAHVLVLLALARSGVTAVAIPLPALLSIPLLTVVCLSISVVVAWGIRKSPLAKYLAG